MEAQPAPLKCVQTVPSYAGVMASVCEICYRMGRFDEISCTCTDSVVAAVKVSGPNGHRTLAEEKLSMHVDVSPRLSALPCFVFHQDVCFTPFDRLS